MTHCDACEQDVQPWQELAFPSGKLINRCPTTGCGATFGELTSGDSKPAQLKRSPVVQVVEASVAEVYELAAPEPVRSQPQPMSHAPGVRGLIDSLELRLAELESEANTIRRMLKAANEGVN